MAFSLSFPLAWLMVLFSPLRAVLQPAFVAIQCIPMFALAPMMVLWFGFSSMAIVVPTALMIFFPMTINIYQGLCSTPKNMLEFFRLHAATPWQVFYKLQLPWALPHLFAGFRIAVALAGIGAVAGEWAGGQEGLGIMMLESRRAADIEMMFGALICVTAMSLFFYALTSWLEYKINQRQHRAHAMKGNVLGLMLASLVLGGCQSTPFGDKKTTMVLDWLPNPNHIPLYAGVRLGYFHEQGIDLVILKVADPSDSVPYLTSGQTDLSLTYMPHTLLSLARGAPVIPMGILIQEPLNALIFRSGEGVITPEDLDNRILGYSVDGFNTRFLEKILANRHVHPKELVNVSFDLVGMLATKRVDAIYGAYWNIETESLRAHWVETSYFPLSDFGVPPYDELIVLARQGSREAELSFVSAFQKALQKSIDFARAYPKEAFEAYLDANPDKSQKTRQWEWLAWQKTMPALATKQEIDSVKWNHFVDWLIEAQLIDGSKREMIIWKLGA